MEQVPDGLTRRAESFILVHGVQVTALDVDEHRQRWAESGIADEEIDRVGRFQQRWGGLALPPSPEYDGGPRYFDADMPEGSVADGWWFDVGPQRAAVPYAFMVGPGGEFGIHSDRWVTLHASVDGWVESLALAYYAAVHATTITKVAGDEVDGIPLDGFEQVPEVAGLADTWWRGPGSLVAIYTGEAVGMSAPAGRTARIYSGLDGWDLPG